jgi:transposase
MKNTDASADKITQLELLIVEKDVALSVREQKIKLLEEEVRLLRHKRFGASSEKISADQLSIFNEAEDEQLEVPADEITKKPARKKRRVSIPEDIPRDDVVHDLPENEKVCPHDGTPLKYIGAETSEQLDIIPEQIRVLRHVRHKYACPCCQQYVVTAKKPAQPIEKSIASPRILARVATAKYCDALPLYRQVTQFERIGIELDRQTLANWMIKLGALVQPLINRLQEFAVAQPFVHMDETPCQVLKEPGKAAQSKSYMWVMAATHASESVVLFHYSQTRSADTIRELLADFNGVVVSDGYVGYDAALTAEQNLGCWAHARRYFDEAVKAQASKKAGKANQALAFIQKLYAIEKLAADKTADERLKIRQDQSHVVIEKLKTWLDKTLRNILPEGKLGKAVKYLNNQWPKLIRYLEDGRWPIDNNRAENAIRPFAIGRKNWLFSNSQAGARASANLYSIVETAKSNGLNPHAYLLEIFEKLPQAQTLGDVDALLPWAVKGVVG